MLFTIIGALIGAGFASGQEMYLFFYRFGINGILGILLCGFMIGYIIYKTLKIIYDKKIENYRDFLKCIFKNKSKLINTTNIIVSIFLCISFFIMISGFGTYFYQQFGINKYIGSFFIALICYFIFLKNIGSITKINSVIVPVLITIIIIIGIKNLITLNATDIGANTPTDNSLFWIFQSLIYSSYNLILVIPVLINLKEYVKSKKQIILVSLIAGLIMICISILTFLLLTKVNVSFAELEMPIVYVIENNFTNFKYIYGILILSAIFTTAISIGISFLNNIVKNEKSFPQIAGILCITSVIVSGIGFSNLVKILFPLFGFLGLVQIAFLVGSVNETSL